MSFKRDGDDFGWLNRIRKRRIDELLSADIPEDEALLMKNGRFCCTVCSNRPIFDTAQMLAIHRGGKNHLRSAERANQEKLDIELLKLKREHETYLSTGNVTSSKVNLASNGNLKLAAATPYKPRLKKKKHMHDRRQRIDLCEEQNVSNNSKDLLVEPTGSAQPNSVLTPYKSQHMQAPGSSKHTVKHKMTEVAINGLQNAPKTISEYVKLNKSESRTMTLKPYGHSLSEANNVTYNQRTGNTSVQPSYGAPVHMVHGITASSGDRSKCGAPAFWTDSSVPKVKGKSTKTKVKQSQQPAVDEDKAKSAEKYLQARGAGWKKDLSGNWVREEGVEFDSDEEPPDLP